MKRCLQCGAEYSDYNKWCSHCHGPLMIGSCSPDLEDDENVDLESEASGDGDSSTDDDDFSALADPLIRSEWLDSDRLKLDYASPLETVVFSLMVLLILACVFFLAMTCVQIGEGEGYLLPIVLLAVSIWLLVMDIRMYRGMDIYFIIDRRDRKLFLHRTIMAKEHDISLCDFKDIAIVTVEKKHALKEYKKDVPYYDSTPEWSYRVWKYFIVLEQTSGKKHRLTDPLDAYSLATGTAMLLARFMDVAFRPGEEGDTVPVIVQETRGKFRIRRTRYRPVEIALVVAAGLAAFAGMFYLLRMAGML